MKKIVMKIVPITLNGQTGTLDYKEQLIAIVRTPSNPQGADYEEVRKSIRLLDILEKTDGTLQLEDADHAYLCERVTHARYLLIDKAVQAFIEDVTHG